MSKIVDLIHAIVKPLIKDQSTRAKVISVDMNQFTCEVETLRIGSQRFEVNLRSISGGDEVGWILVPKVESLVIISNVDNKYEDCYISQFSELDGIVYVIKDKTQLRSTSDGKWKWKATTEIWFDGATNGLVKIPDLVTKLNNLENKVNTIISTFNAHVHPETGTTTGPPATPVTGTLSNTVQNDLKHNKIEF